MKRCILLSSCLYALSAFSQAPTLDVEPRVIHVDFGNVLHIAPWTAGATTIQFQTGCPACTNVGQPFPATVRPGTNALKAEVPRWLTNDLPPGDYTLAIGGASYKKLKITLKRTAITPQIFGSWLGVDTTRKHFMDPDNDPDTNDQILDAEEAFLPWGVIGQPGTQRLDKVQGKNYIDRDHEALGGSPGIQVLGELHGILPLQYWFGGSCDFDTDCPGCKQGTTAQAVQDWSDFRVWFDDWCNQEPCGQTASYACDFAANAPGQGANYRSESIFIDPSGNHTIDFNGQDQSDHGQTDPAYDFDKANADAVTTLGKKIVDRVDYWDKHPDPNYGSSQIDYFILSEPSLQHSIPFDPPNLHRYQPSFVVPPLYFNSPTYSAAALQNFTDFVSSYCGQTPKPWECQGAWLPAPDTNGRYHFPVLSGDFYGPPGSAMKDRCIIWDPTDAAKAKYWDIWTRWRYQLLADMYANLAGRAAAASTKDTIKFGYFQSAFFSPWNRVFHVTNPGQPAERRWLYSPDEDVFPASQGSDHCRPTVYVDRGADPVVMEQAFRANNLDLETFVVEEGANGDHMRMALDQLQRDVNRLNRDRGDATGQYRYSQAKTGALFNLRNSGDGTFFEQFFRDPALFQTSSAPNCDFSKGYEPDEMRHVVAQLKSFGMQIIHAFAATWLLNKCKNGGQTETTRTPFYGIWKAIVDNLAEETVYPRTINANRLRNGSFEKAADPSATPRRPYAWSAAGSGSVVLTTPPAPPKTNPPPVVQPFQGEGYADITGPVTLTSARILVDPARLYRCQGYVRGSGTVTLRVRFFGAYDFPAGGSYEVSKPNPGSDWWQMVLPQMSPASNAVYARVEIEAASGAAIDADNIWFWDDTGSVNPGVIDAPNYLENPSMELVRGEKGGVPGSLPQGWTPSDAGNSGVVLRLADVRTNPPDPQAKQGARYLTIEAPTGIKSSGTWVSDRFFADSSETYGTITVWMRSRGGWTSGSVATATIRWYREDQDGDTFLREDTIGSLWASGPTGTWLQRTIAATPPREAITARIYLTFASKGGGAADFDAALLHGEGPQPLVPPVWSPRPCTGGTPDPPVASFTVDPHQGEVPMAVYTTNNTTGATRLTWTATHQSGAQLVSGGSEPDFYLQSAGTWTISLEACNGSACANAGPESVTVTPASQGPSASQVVGQAAGPGTFDSVTIYGSGFKGLPNPSRVRFGRTCQSCSPDFPAAGVSVVSDTEIRVTTPIGPGGKSGEDTGPTSTIWVVNPDGKQSTKVPFVFTYRPVILSALGPTVDPGGPMTIKGNDFIDAQGTDTASVIFSQGATTIEEPAVDIMCRNGGNPCGQRVDLDVIVPSGLVPGPATVQVRKVRSFGLNDGRVSKPSSIMIADRTPPSIVDAYPPPGSTGASTFSEISVTVADIGSGLAGTPPPTMSCSPACNVMSIFPDPALGPSTSFTLRARPAGLGWPTATPVSVTLEATELGGGLLQLPFSFTVTDTIDRDGFSGFGDGLPDDWEVMHFEDTRFIFSSDTDRDGSRHFSEYQHGTNADSIYRMITAPGALPENPAEVLLYAPFGALGALWNGYKPDAASAGFRPYTTGFGANVAAGDMDVDGSDEIVTGPGPGAGYGSIVRAFEVTGQSRGIVWFPAYATPGYGVNVASGDIDGDGLDEILTAPGPGQPFGPHIRGFRVGGQTATPMGKVSFIAYPGVLNWGANVDRADVDGDGIDEIVTGPGPGSGLGAHVRGFNFDGVSLAGLPGFGCCVYGSNYGVRVAGGDVDGDGKDEIVTGPGPAPAAGPQVKVYDYDNSSLNEKTAFFAFPSDDKYGVGVASGGDLDATGSGAGIKGLGDEILAFQGTPRPDMLDGEPRYLSRVKVYDGSSLPVTRKAEFTAFDIPGLVGGAKAAVGHFDGNNAFPAAPSPANLQIQVIRDLLVSTPDSQTVDYTIDPTVKPDINVWSSDLLKEEALADLDFLVANLSGMDAPSILSRLQDVSTRIASGLLNESTRDALLGAIDSLSALYENGTLCSGAVVARIPLSEAGSVVALATSPLAPDAAFVASGSASGTSTISRLALATGAVEDRETVDTAFQDMAVSVADGTLVGLRCDDPGGSCPPQQTASEVFREPLGRPLGTATTSQSLQSPIGAPDVLVETPSPHRPKGHARAAAFSSAASSGPVGILLDLGGMPGSPETTITHQTPSYHDMAASPIPGDDRLFAIHDAGIDAINPETGSVTEMAIPGIGGDDIEAVELDSGEPLLYALDTSSGLTTTYDLATGGITAQISTPGAIGIKPVPIRKDLLVTLTPSALVLTDGRSGIVRRRLPICPGGTGFTITADGTRALVTNASSNTLDVVLIAPEDIPAIARGVADLFDALPDEAYSMGQAVLACDQFKGAGNSLVESFGFDGDRGNVATNGRADLAGNCVVNGDIILGQNGTATIHGNATVTGTTTTLPIPLSCDPVDLAALRGRISTANDNSTIPPTGKGKSVWHGQGEFEVEDDDTATIPEGIYFMTKMEISGGSTVIVTGPTTIFVSGEMKISEGGKLLAQPGPVMVFSDGDEEFELKDGEADLVLYAPYAELSLEGSNETLLAGSAFVDEAKIAGSAVLRRSASVEAGALREWFHGEFDRLGSEIASALSESDPVRRNGALDVIISDIQSLGSQMDGSAGGDPTNDWIRDDDRQQVLLPVLRNLIRRLQASYLAVPGPPDPIP